MVSEQGHVILVGEVKDDFEAFAFCVNDEERVSEHLDLVMLLPPEGHSPASLYHHETAVEPGFIERDK